LAAQINKLELLFLVPIIFANSTQKKWLAYLQSDQSPSLSKKFA